MKAWGLAAVLLLAAWVAGCGGNSTAVGITITGPAAAPLSIIISRPSVQFTATVTGISASTVFWQICEPPATPSTTIPPTLCTQGQGPTTGCTIPTVKSPIAGFGTITANGLYTPPATVPNPASVLIVASSCVRSTAFGTFAFTLDSGIRVQVLPNTATIDPGDSFQFTANVTGTNDTSVVWLVNGIPGGDATHGFICPDGNIDGANLCNANNAGEYFAPNTSPGAVTVGAQSGADPTQIGTAAVTVGSGTAPSLQHHGPEPQVAAEGSAQQDVYLSGTNIFSTTHGCLWQQCCDSGGRRDVHQLQPAPGHDSRFLLLRRRATSRCSASNRRAARKLPGRCSLTVVPVRPVVIAATPNSVQQSGGGVSLTASLTGGYFVPGKTLATFNGLGCGGGGRCLHQLCRQPPSDCLNSGRRRLPRRGFTRWSFRIATPPLAGVPSLTGLNLAVNPSAGQSISKAGRIPLCRWAPRRRFGFDCCSDGSGRRPGRRRQHQGRFRDDRQHGDGCRRRHHSHGIDAPTGSRGRRYGSRPIIWPTS